MVIESKTAPHPPADLKTPVIENELPAYRAISAGAVTSLVLGFCSIFCFTSPWFLLVVAASVFFGWRALRTIRRLPDILTGTSLAQTGIGLGLVFGLSATTHLIVQDLMLSYEASQFAKKYVDVLKTEPIGLALWYRQNPEYRKLKSPDEVVAELKRGRNPAKQDDYAEQSEQIVAIKERLKGANQEIHFAKLESRLIDGVTSYANALVDLDGPDGEKFALIEMIKNSGNQGDWRVKEIRYPYQLASVAVQAEKKDDGHGHGGH